MQKSTLALLPPEAEIETLPVLKALAPASRALAELKGYANLIPNKHILINAIVLLESKDSSAIENIITTHDDLYQEMAGISGTNPAAKEVVHYREALWHGYELVRERCLLTTNVIVEIQSIVEANSAGIRKLPVTVLMNAATGETVYTPPAGEAEIRTLLANLEKYIHDDSDGVDPLIKLAVIHHQFECIHPFYDGNGRTGRILNVLYLVLKNLLDSPILYLSRYFIQNKGDYYRLLNAVQQANSWEAWIVYVLRGIEQTAAETLLLAKCIHEAIQQTSVDVKTALPKIHSDKLIDLMFFEFYTKIQYVQEGLGVSRKTASTYLQALETAGFLTSHKIGKERIYQNRRLLDLLESM